MATIPVCLSIAGSDSGGGAGIQADLKTFQRLGCFGTTALTALTAQNPHGVRDIHPVPPDHVRAQLRALAEAFTIGAAKTGMLFSAEIIRAVAEEWPAFGAAPLVVDPVMVATSGARLLRADAVAAMQAELLPQATILTPNLPEAELLWDRPIPDLATAATAAGELSRRFGAAVLVKGGHREGTPGTDVLVIEAAAWQLYAPPLDARCTHGTGCTLSSALAAELALGRDLPTAVRRAKAYVWAALQRVGQVGPETWNFLPPESCDAASVTVTPLS